MDGWTLLFGDTYPFRCSYIIYLLNINLTSTFCFCSDSVGELVRLILATGGCNFQLFVVYVFWMGWL
jgi:hypothetical protein